MKKCPICGSQAFDDATTCFECLYSFERMSCMAVLPEGDTVVEGAGKVELAPDTDQDVIEDGGQILDPSLIVLVVEDPEFGERRFSLASGSLYVGRLPTNEVVLNDKTVSRRHLHVFVEGSHLWAEDFGSTNPTLLNGMPLGGRSPLKAKDVLQVRSAVLRIESAAS